MEYSENKIRGYRQLADLHQALAHPVRLHILDILARGEACVCHLTAVLGRRQPYVSQQLAALRDAGLVADRRVGTLVYYRVRDARMVALLALAQSIVTVDGDAALRFPGVPEGAVADCPCPKCRETDAPVVRASRILQDA
jgi:DNA-binding transcriptional ArsR family regulator